MRRLLPLALLLALPAQACAAEAEGLNLPPINFIRVDKAERRMTLYSGNRPVHVIENIQLGDAPVGQKFSEGDERTPEGIYFIHARNPASAYHLSLRVSYPTPEQALAAEAEGRDPGGDIFVHGQPNGLIAGRMEGDWTDGCIAVSNAEIEALWAAVADGTPIEIRP